MLKRRVGECSRSYGKTQAALVFDPAFPGDVRLQQIDFQHAMVQFLLCSIRFFCSSLQT